MVLEMRQDRTRKLQREEGWHHISDLHVLLRGTGGNRLVSHRFRCPLIEVDAPVRRGCSLGYRLPADRRRGLHFANLLLPILPPIPTDHAAFSG